MFGIKKRQALQERITHQNEKLLTQILENVQLRADLSQEKRERGDEGAEYRDKIRKLQEELDSLHEYSYTAAEHALIIEGFARFREQSLHPSKSSGLATYQAHNISHQVLGLRQAAQVIRGAEQAMVNFMPIGILPSQEEDWRKFMDKMEANGE